MMNSDAVYTKTIRKPGQAGTKQLCKIYGDDLVCVRYKYDYKKCKRYKTVEIVIEEKEWNPPLQDPLLNERVYVQVFPYEIKLRKEVKSMGGIWNADKKLWKLPMKVIWALNIEERIVNNKKIRAT